MVAGHGVPPQRNHHQNEGGYNGAAARRRLRARTLHRRRQLGPQIGASRRARAQSAFHNAASRMDLRDQRAQRPQGLLLMSRVQETKAH